LTFNFFVIQGKFVRIHFGTNGKIAGADIETCELAALLVGIPCMYATLLIAIMVG